MFRTPVLPLCLVIGAVSFSACKKSQKGAEAGPSPAAAKPDQAAKKEAQPAQAKVEAPKDCAAPLEPGSNFVPGSVVSLSAPKGFQLAKHFPGFQRGKGKGKPSISVSEFPMPIASAKSALSNEALWTRQEMTFVSSKDLEHKASAGSCNGTFIEVKQESGDDAAQKFVWLFGDEKRSFQIMATCPEPCAKADADSLRQSIQTARWNPAREPKRWDGLSFKLDASPLKPIKGVPMSGYRRTFTTKGLPDNKGESELFQFGSSMDPVKEKTVDFAKQTIKRVPLTGVKFIKESEIKALGLEGWDFEVKAWTRSGTEQAVRYTVLFDEDAYWVALGMCPVAKKAACEKSYKKILNSVTFIEST